MIEDLIIIIPTHNRQHYLGRVIKYYSEFPCKVYICDSSKEKADIDSCGSIIYRWVPQSNFYGKVLDVLNETSADFYALSPDDDFLKQETLMECYEVMKKEESYSFGTGRQVLFKKEFDNILTSPDYSNRMKDIAGIVFNDRKEYIKYFEENYQNILWSLYRKDIIKNTFGCLSRCNFTNGNFVEMILGIEALRCGDVYMSKEGLNYRELISSDHWGNTTLSITRKNIEKDVYLNKDVIKFYEYYNNDEHAIFCFESYLNAVYNQPQKVLIKRIKDSIPNKLKLIIRNGINMIYGRHAISIYEDNIMVERINKVINNVRS